jgi:hypothetical protein
MVAIKAPICGSHVKKKNSNPQTIAKSSPNIKNIIVKINACEKLISVFPTMYFRRSIKISLIVSAMVLAPLFENAARIRNLILLNSLKRKII